MLQKFYSSSKKRERNERKVETHRLVLGWCKHLVETKNAKKIF